MSNIKQYKNAAEALVKATSVCALADDISEHADTACEAIACDDLSTAEYELGSLALSTITLAQITGIDIHDALQTRADESVPYRFGTIHVLKSAGELPPDEKTFELRKDDRDFRVGDTVLNYKLSEPNKWKAGRITHIMRDKPEWGLMEGYAILAIDWYGKTICKKVVEEAKTRGLA